MSKPSRLSLANGSDFANVDSSLNNSPLLPTYTARINSEQVVQRGFMVRRASPPRYTALFPPDVGSSFGQRELSESRRSTQPCDDYSRVSPTNVTCTPTAIFASSSTPVATSARPPTTSTISIPTQPQDEQQRDFSYRLSTSSGHSWLEVVVRTGSGSPMASLGPVITDEPLHGDVILDFPKAEKLKAITLSFVGALSFKHSEQIIFYQQSQVLWNSGMGDPRYHSTNAGGSHRSQHKGSGASFHGRYEYPFVFNIPAKAPLSLGASTIKDLRLPNSESHLVKLPPSFDGGAWHASISYALIVKVKRAGIITTDSKLTIPVVFCPLSSAEPPSRLRRLAYEQNTPLLGPDQDPEGWTSMPINSFIGTLFRDRDVQIRCTLCFARPLAYGLGSHIPLSLTLFSSDKQALDVLSASESGLPEVLLKRVPSSGGEDVLAQPLLVAKAEWERASRRSETCITDDIAFDKMSSECSTSSLPIFKTSLMGKITIPFGLTPSFSFGKIGLVYMVDMLPPTAPGFIPTEDDVLSRTEVTIYFASREGTRYSPGLSTDAQQ